MGSKTDTEGARAREPNQEKNLKFSHWMNKITMTMTDYNYKDRK